MSSGGHGGGGLPFLDIIQDNLHKAHSEGGFMLPVEWLYIAAVVEVVGFFLVSPSQTIANFGLLMLIAPIWIPILLQRFSLIRAIDARRVSSSTIKRPSCSN